MRGRRGISGCELRSLFAVLVRGKLPLEFVLVGGRLFGRLERAAAVADVLAVDVGRGAGGREGAAGSDDDDEGRTGVSVRAAVLVAGRLAGQLEEEGAAAAAALTDRAEDTEATLAVDVGRGAPAAVGSDGTAVLPVAGRLAGRLRAATAAARADTEIVLAVEVGREAVAVAAAGV